MKDPQLAAVFIASPPYFVNCWPEPVELPLPNGLEIAN
jgi:hypothetical protein